MTSASRTALPKGVEGSLESFALVPKLTGRPSAKNTAATNLATVLALWSELVPLISLLMEALKKAILSFKVLLSSSICFSRFKP